MTDGKQTIGLRLRVFVPFACGYFLSYLYRVVNSVIAPNLVDDIGVDPSELGLLTSAYFITFAAAQLPLGVLLDRFGPRKIEAFLLLFAGIGAWVFAEAETLTGLVAGRALIGFGVSACLMAAFKAYVIWYPREQLPLINGYQMAAGGLGALAATAPVEAALAITDWRGVFTALAVLTLVIAALVFFVVPERAAAGRELRFGEQVRGIKRVFSSLVFWRIAPWTTLSQATFLSIQGLWAGPWLRDVAGYDRHQVAGTLLLVAVAMVSGFILLGTAAERLSRKGVRPLVVAATGMMLFMGVLLLIILEIRSAAMVLWGLFGFFGTSRHSAVRGAVPELSPAAVGTGQHRCEPAGVRDGLHGPVGHRFGHRAVAGLNRRGICAGRLPGVFQHHARRPGAHVYVVYRREWHAAPPRNAWQ